MFFGDQHRPQQPLHRGGWRVLLRQRPSFRTKYWQPLEVGEDYCGCAHIVFLEGDAGRQYEEGPEIKGQAMQSKVLIVMNSVASYFELMNLTAFGWACMTT